MYWSLYSNTKVYQVFLTEKFLDDVEPNFQYIPLSLRSENG